MPSIAGKHRPLPPLLYWRYSPETLDDFHICPAEGVYHFGTYFSQVQQLQLPPPEGGLLYDLKQPAPALAFDTQQELLWVGNESGRITSYYGPGLQRYTSLRTHPANEGRVTNLLFHDRGVISLASKSLHLMSRRGLTQWHIADDSMSNLQCMSFISKDNSEVLVAGCQNSMFKIDVEKGTVVQEIPTDHEYTIMKFCRYICAATNKGAVNFLNPETFEVLKTWQAHPTEVHDMDAHNNYLVTCGKAPRLYGPQMLEHFAKVYDLQKLQQLSPINFPGGAAFVRIVPKLSTTAIIATQTGRLQVVDLMNPDTVNLHQADVSIIRTLTLAPSGSVWAMLDQDNAIRLWGGSREKLRFAEHPNPTEFADEVAPVPSMSLDTDLPFSTIGMPYYHERLLSAWPSDHVFEVGRMPSKIDADILKSMLPTNVGYRALNPRKTLRNQADRTKVLDSNGTMITAPRFLSEKNREAESDQSNGKSNGRRISDAVEAFANATLAGSTSADVPIEYRNVEIKYSKFGVQDFDFHYYNKTRYSGLETHITNSYLNPLLQLLKFTPPIRNLALHHVASGCLSDLCLLCEMGFLFDMLEKAAGQSCQATNLYKTLGSIPDAAGLQILEERAPQNTLDYRMQAANRFILKQMSSDSRRVYPDDTRLDQVLVTNAVSTLRCLHCYSETMRPNPTYLTDLSYPNLNQNSRVRNAIPTFSEVLKRSLEYATQIRAWCNRCRRYQELATRTTVHNTAPVLMLNACLDKYPESRQLWAIPGWLPEQIGIIIEGVKVSCFEGENLRNLQRTRHNYAVTVYELVGIVAEINSKENQKSHLVSLVNVAISEREAQEQSEWHLMNDFLVRKIDESDRPLHFFPTWKTPVVLTYQIRGARHAIDDTWKELLDTSCLYDAWSMNSVTDPFNLPLNPETEEPHPGACIALDGEFVNLRQEEIEIKADGDREVIRPTRMGLARVSVLRGDRGGYEGIPFINDYIPIYEPIVDYNTQYSGLREGDLDPRISQHPLVPLKVAYKKLWLLLNLGCVFIGHGLPKDLRVANIHIPKEQVIDTADLFFIAARKRRFSLQFLAWYLLNEEIQSRPEGHDSIEDARTALRLWRRYEELDREPGAVERCLEEVYREGRRVGFRPPGEGGRGGAGGGRGGDGRSTDGGGGRDTPEPGRVGGTDSGVGTPVGRKVGTGLGSWEYFESPLR